MQVTLNGLNLMTGYYALDDIQFDSSPTLEFSDLAFASADGAKFISSRYTPKTLTMRGRIVQTTVALLEAEMDNFKKTLLKDSNINLNFSYANGFRQYIGNVQNLILSRKNFNITYVPFEITFIAEDPPFAYAISDMSAIMPTMSEVFSADGIIGNTYSHTLTMSGTAPPLARWTYLLDSVSGRIEQMIFKSITTGKQLELNAALSAGDEVVIEQENLEVKLNSLPVEYEGVFPSFNIGGNELQWQIYGTNEVTSGIYLDQSQQVRQYGVLISQYSVAQTFVPSTTATLGKVSLQVYRYSYVTDKLRCYIYDTSTGIPTTLLATASNFIDTATMPLKQWVWLDFDFSQSLTSGTTYAIVLSYDGATGTYPNALMYGYASGQYSSGSWFINYGSSWTNNSNLDLTFKTYMTQTTTRTFDHTSSLKVEQRKRFL